MKVSSFSDLDADVLLCPGTVNIQLCLASVDDETRDVKPDLMSDYVADTEDASETDMLKYEGEYTEINEQ